jgi:hypothetical protein
MTIDEQVRAAVEPEIKRRIELVKTMHEDYCRERMIDGAYVRVKIEAKLTTKIKMIHETPRTESTGTHR